MPLILVEFTPSICVYLLLDETTVLGYGGVDLSFWAGDNFEFLV